MRAIVLCGLLSLSACAQVAPQARPSTVEQAMVITDAAQVEAAVGKKVTLRGVVLNSKIASLLGVDVESESPDLRGEAAEATGMLRKQVVTKEEIARLYAELGIVAHRDVGTYYSLVDDSGRLAQVRRPR